MRNVLTAATAAALAFGTPAFASVRCDRNQPAPCSRLAEVEVLDRTTGERLQVYWRDGQRWVAGTPGHRYAISITNGSAARILGVIAVDGVNAISGETADWNQGGYVLGPWQSFDILGWRKSRANVADFVFTSLDDSYAARTGRPDDVGVIGVAVFREATHEAPAITPDRQGRSSSSAVQQGQAAREPAPSDAASAATPAERDQPSGVTKIGPPRPSLPGPLGTGHGQNEASWVSTTQFDRAQEHPDQVISIRYDRLERLIAMGIIPGAGSPRPFPGSADSGFVADPPAR